MRVARARAAHSEQLPEPREPRPDARALAAQIRADDARGETEDAALAHALDVVPALMA